jgi:Uma2 family endonuclease
MYPDVYVVCRPLAPDEDRVTDPRVAFEVLSPTSETFDRIYRWREYQRIASLRHFVLIEQKERCIQVYSRDRDGWQLGVVEPPDDAVVLKVIGTKLSLEAIYEGSGR